MRLLWLSASILSTFLAAIGLELHILEGSDDLFRFVTQKCEEIVEVLEGFWGKVVKGNEEKEYSERDDS